MDLNKKELVFLQKYVKDVCGLVVPDSKEYLFTFRLGPVLEDFNLSGYEELCEKLKSGDEKLRERVVTELTTHETFFFRDNHPFEAFKEVILPWLGEMIQERKNKPFVRKGPKVNIWSAACSTGQEPYSLAMLINEFVKSSSAEAEDFSILGTDVSSAVLSEAMLGVYSKFAVERGTEGEGGAFRKQYFEASGNDFEVREMVKNLVEFKYCNLMDPLEHLGGFDVIFCRNVLIYFDEETKVKIIEQLHRMLSPGGYLMVGSSENIYGASALFEPVTIGKSLFFRKKGYKGEEPKRSFGGANI